ncbi:MAG: quinol:electron acceptor oxidoreductase subunit ActD [Ignavibacteria bacterium]
MSDKILYSVTGVFDTPDEIIKAAEAAADAGYTKYDINTSYPVHGMSNAMRIKPSSLSYIALVFGLSGAALALLAMWYISSSSYPLIIGGKPYFSLPAFIPIIFEITVLLASVMTVVSMLAIFFKFPNNSHPLHDTRYMKMVSSDKFGISIQASDPLFDEKKVNRFLVILGAQLITKIYFDEDELNVKNNVFEPKFIGFLAMVFLAVAGLTYFTLNYLMFMPPFNWMANQPKLNPQHKTVLFADGFGMRLPVEGSVARGFEPYLYKGNQASASKNLINPLLPVKENLSMGRMKFDIFCSPCHGYFAKGDSRLRGQFPNPPSLHSEKVRNFRDGDIYHIITEGQNVMPSYAKQISREERWAVILYVRALQRSQNAKETDIK